MNNYKKKGIKTAPAAADQNQEMFDFTPSPFSIKETWMLTQESWLLGLYSTILLACCVSE